jgi:hypothetical protein
MARLAGAAGEFAERPGQAITVERFENIMIGGVARRALNAKQRQRFGRQVY